MMALRGSRPASGKADRQGLARLLAMIGTRGLDQLALGAASLLIARRVGTEAFAPFATIFILYSLTAQIGDGGLAFAILRTPAGRPLAHRARAIRTAAAGAMAVVAVVSGLLVGGSTGTVIAIGGATLVTGPAVFVGRAALQWAGDTRRLSVGEAAGALAFIVAVVALVRDGDDLALFGLLCVGKHLVELGVQGWRHEVFRTNGAPVRTSGIFVSQAVTYLAANVDYVVVGAMLGAEALSIYAIGFRLASAFSSIVSAPLTRTAFVDFANADELQSRHDTLVKRIGVFGSLGAVVTAAAALALPTILGPEWLESRLVTAVLGMALPWRLLLGPVVALGLIKASARRVIGWETVRAFAIAAAIVAGSGSIEQASAAVAGATILSIGWAYRRSVRRADISPSGRMEAAGLIVAGVAVAIAVLG